MTGEILKIKLMAIREWLSQGKNQSLIEEIFHELNPRLSPIKKKPNNKAIIKKKKNSGK